MFKDQDEDVVFFESAMHLHNMPHMVWNCVPVPIEIGDTAPIYFKKALLECETEWAINKKVIDLCSKDVRRSVPKGLPYFAVDFGMQGGYAHVIEDEKMFPNNFAEVSLLLLQTILCLQAICNIIKIIYVIKLSFKFFLIFRKLLVA